MSSRIPMILVALSIMFGPTVQAQSTPAASVSELLDRHDRSLVKDLESYLRTNPRADDRDQAYAALFNKAIEHDWFPDNEATALLYLKNDPEGPVKALAQIIITMARAGAGRYDEALARYRELMAGLGKSDQEEFATSFSDTFASAAVSAGEFATARAVYRVLQERFPDSETVRNKAAREVGRLDRVGTSPPALEVRDIEGKSLRLESLRGKFVLVDFWATWCAPCLTELPRLQEAHRKYHALGFEIVAVSLDETRGAVADFVKSRKLPWPQVHNPTAGADLVEALGVSSIPASYLIDPGGKIVRLDLRGPNLEATLAKLIPTRQAAK